MEIREAVPDDNDVLKKLQAKCPQGTDLIVSVVNTPDFFARAKAYESYKVYVACEGDTIIASSACALRNALVKGKLSRVGYSFQTFVHPNHRKKNLAKRLLQNMEDDLIQNGAVLVYGLIMERNLPSIKLVESLGFKLHRKLVMPGLIIRKEVATPSGENIRSVRTDDLTNVAKLLNETWQNHDLYEPASADILARFISRTPKFSMENLLVLENRGEILACLGFWDWSKVMKLTLQSLNLKMKTISRLLFITRVLPKVLKPGDELNQIMLISIGYKEPSHLAILIRYINNIAFKKGIKQIFCISERKHPMLNSLEGFIRISTNISLYVKPLKDNLKLHEAPVFVDGIDM
ncbi:MAG: GNAT family N-acetyltransferase [Deltaproteobacteria bacterium]|jgi:L-amino acid N-acyltransferase YncA|nr:GNAT family N-acetyltransferase [Deltaproteobacteria bacterium]